VTFLAQNGSSIPIQLSYKDADGNIITSRQDVAITVADSAQKTDQPSIIPVIGFLLFIALAGGYLYLKRRKNQ
jgi:LPXTG-motif cell wall-anchored protein